MAHDEFNPAALLGERPTADLARLRSRGVILGAVGLVGAAAGYFTRRRRCSGSRI